MCAGAHIRPDDHARRLLPLENARARRQRVGRIIDRQARAEIPLPRFLRDTRKQNVELRVDLLKHPLPHRFQFPNDVHTINRPVLRIH